MQRVMIRDYLEDRRPTNMIGIIFLINTRDNVIRVCVNTGA